MMKNVSLMNCYHFLHGLIFYLPIFALLLEAKLSSVVLVTTIMAIQSVLITVFEVPSGLLLSAFLPKTK